MARDHTRAVALAFRPGTFRPVLGSSVSALRDRQATVEELFGCDDLGLAADLGYSDRSHLIRAFTKLVGRPPATYAAQV